MLEKIITLSGLIILGMSGNAFAKNVQGVLVPVIGEPESLTIGSGIAQKSDVLFSQQLIAEKTATLEKAFYLQRDNRFKSKFDLNSDDILYAVTFPKHDIAYCSVKTGYSQKPMTGKRWQSQICLIDTDKDGAFDLEYAGAVRKFDSSPLSLGILWSDDLGIEALPYKVSESNSDASVNARLDLSKASSKSLKFKVMVQRVEGDWTEHGKETVKIAKYSTFPIIADVYGAKIQINAIDGKTVNYEIISGFSETEPLMLE